MNFNNKKIFFTILLILVFTGLIYAQPQYSLEKQLRNILIQGYGEPYLKGYLQPFATTIGTIMGGAAYYCAYTRNFPHFDIGISGAHLKIPNQSRTFVYKGEEVPTVFGSDEVGSTGIPGSELNSFTLSQFHLNLGLFSNFELMLRGKNIFPIDEIGNINQLGLGIKYNISDLLPASLSTWDLSAQVIYQILNVEKWLRAAIFGMNIQTSKGLPVLPLDIYGGVGFEITSLKIKTDSIPDIGSYGIGDVSIEGENKFRLTIGLSITLLVLNIHADYNLGTYDSFSGGLMIIL